jgi:hypothetical protein
MRLKARKGTVGEFYLKVGEEYLSVGFVPLCAPKRPLTVRCPLCGIVMVALKTKGMPKDPSRVVLYAHGYEYFCPECGIRG